jgi:hypothetical protein
MADPLAGGPISQEHVSLLIEKAPRVVVFEKDGRRFFVARSSHVISNRLSRSPMIVIAGAKPLQSGWIMPDDRGVHMLRESTLPRIVFAHST